MPTAVGNEKAASGKRLGLPIRISTQISQGAKIKSVEIKGKGTSSREDVS
jgi:hypothetical protein